MIISCSLDCKIILWNIEKEGPEKIFELNDAPTCLSFHPELENIFITGSLDQSIRRWSIDQSEKCLDDHATSDYITALSFSPNGKRLVVGLSTGICNIFHCDELGRLNWSTKIDCKNRKGKFSLGRKVSGI